MHVAIMCSSSGTIHGFRLFSDQEIFQDIVNKNKNKLALNQSWSLMDKILPLNYKYQGSDLRIHLRNINEKPDESVLQNMPYFAFI